MSVCYDCKYGNWVLIAPEDDWEFECLCQGDCTTANGYKCFEKREKKS